MAARVEGRDMTARYKRAMVERKLQSLRVLGDQVFNLACKLEQVGNRCDLHGLTQHATKLKGFAKECSQIADAIDNHANTTKQNKGPKRHAQR